MDQIRLREGTKSIARERYQRQRLDAPNVRITVSEIDNELFFSLSVNLMKTICCIN